jgi:hypothetical protein
MIIIAVSFITCLVNWNNIVVHMMKIFKETMIHYMIRENSSSSLGATALGEPWPP